MAKIKAIEEAVSSIRLETYIFTATPVGLEFREALERAATRGVAVQVLVDGIGSNGLPTHFFDRLEQLGGEQKWFNRPSIARWSLRDHRKVLLIDDCLAFVGGCNISQEYYGDGVTVGWRDGGVAMTGDAIQELKQSFTEQWQRAEQARWDLVPKQKQSRLNLEGEVCVLAAKPGLGHNPLRQALRHDLREAKDIIISSAYFLPSRRLRSQLVKADKRGARVRLLLAGKSDVKLMALASQLLYRGLVRGGIEIYEYLPQTLHAKLMVLDDHVYVGSSNLDPRSLRINFELMLRIRNKTLAAEARAQFERDLVYSRTIQKSATLWSPWSRIKQRLAYFILARMDPWMARGHMRELH